MIEHAHLLIVAAAAYMALLGYAFSRPRNDATRYFMLTLLISGIWNITYYIELTTPAIEHKIAVRLFRNACLAWLPMAFLLMTCTLFGLGRWLPKWFWWITIAINTGWSVIQLSANHHPWLMVDFAIYEFGRMGVLTYTQGPLDNVYHHFQHALVLMPLILIIPAAFQARGLRRQNLVMVLLGVAVPLIMNILFIEGLAPSPHVNIAPYTTVISIAVFSWIVLRNRLLDIVPLARDMLLDQLPDLVLVTDAADRIVDFNHAFACTLALPLTDWKGKSARELPEPWWNVIKETGGILSEVVIDGNPHWWETSRRHIKDDDGNRIGALHVMRNVTLRQRAELALRESEDQLRLILDSISEAVFIHDADGHIRFVNKPMLAMFGMTHVEQALAYNIFADYSGAEADFSLASKAIAVVLQHDESRTLYGWKARRPLSGTLFDVHVVLQRILHDNEVMLLATVTDITEHLQREAARVDMERMRAEAQLVAQQARLLRDMHDGLGGLSANIGLQASLGLEEANLEEKNAVFERIESLALEGNAEIRSLMNALERREYIWSDWFNEVGHYGDTICDGRRVMWNFHVEGTPPTGPLSLLTAVSLFRIIKEALHNAVRHGAAQHITLKLSFSATELIITIKDDGCGFDPEKIRPGRGLSNMRKRADELGGTMTLPAVIGTECHFCFPIPIKYLTTSLDYSTNKT